MGSLREREIEKKLVKAVKSEGGMCPKLVSPGTDGMPDRLVMLPKARIGFVEVKAPGKGPRPLQVKRHKQLRDLGFHVFILSRYRVSWEKLRRTECMRETMRRWQTPSSNRQ